MFRAIARFAVRFRWLVVAAWLIGTSAAVLLLPDLATVTAASSTTFLNSADPSVRAATLAQPFQGSTTAATRQGVAATAIIVAARSSGPLTAADHAAIERADQAARRVAHVAAVGGTTVSSDGRAVQVVLTADGTTARDDGVRRKAVDGVRAALGHVDAPPGLSFHLTGPLAAGADAANSHLSLILDAVLALVIVLLFVVYRSLLAPLLTLIPAVLSLTLTQPLLAAAGKAGLPLMDADQQLLIVLVIGIGTDYGLFLTFRYREELARGARPHDALTAAVARVGEAVGYSALTVVAALMALLAAPFAVYRGIGPALAIGVGVTLLASLTLTPALLAICGSAVFWPIRPKAAADHAPGMWGRVAERAVAHPLATLTAGVLIFGALSTGVVGFRTTVNTSTAPTGSDSAAGQVTLVAHFPQANADTGDQLLLKFTTPVWTDPAVLATVQHLLADEHVFASLTGPLGSGAGTVTAAELADLHARLGPASDLPAAPPSTSPVTPQLYQAYRTTADFISPDGLTVQYYATLRAGAAGSAAAATAIPAARNALTATATAVGVSAFGVAGQDASAYDITSASNSSMVVVIPIVLAIMVLLLGLLLRSLVAPWYLAVTVGLSYLATLGLSMIIFVHLGGDGGLMFQLPLLLFVFSMALGEDYNILVMSRIREEAHDDMPLRQALTHAIGITGGTVTSAGIILAGTFAVLGLVPDGTQIGVSIACGVLLDTFFVRTMLVPSIAVLLGRWNWWPSIRNPGT